MTTSTLSKTQTKAQPYSNQDNEEKEVLYGLHPKANLFVIKTLVGDNSYPYRIHSFIPRNLFNESSPQDCRLVPSRKNITLLPFDAYQLIETLQRILPPKHTLSEPRKNYFGQLSPPANSVIQYNNLVTIETDQVNNILP